MDDFSDNPAIPIREMRLTDGQANTQRSASLIEPAADDGEVPIDVLVSVGTGNQTREDRYPNAFEVGGLKQVYLSFIKALDTESAWEDFKRKRSYNASRHHRLNVPLHGSYVGLDDWKSMNVLDKAVQDQFRYSKIVRLLAVILSPPGMPPQECFNQEKCLTDRRLPEYGMEVLIAN